MQDGQFSLYAQDQKAPEYKPLDFSRGYTPSFGPNVNGTLLDDPSLYDDASIAFQSGFTNQLNLFKQAWQETKIGINSSDLMTALVKKANTSRALNQLEADFSLNAIDEVGYLTKKSELLDSLNEAYLDIEESQSDVMRHEKRKNARPVSKDFLRKSQLAMLRGSDASLSDKFKYVLPSVAGSSFSTMVASLSAGFLGQLVKNAVVRGLATSAAGSVVPGLGNVTGFIAGAATVFGTNLLGRHLESKAEVGNQFNQDYEVLKDRYLASKPAGYQLSEDEENDLILKAAAGADEMYWKNMSLVVSDTIQSMIFAGGFAKAFNGLRNVNKTTRLLAGAGEFYLAKKLEGIEEGLQYAFGNRKSLESKGIEDDLGFLSGLMRDYSDVVSSISIFGVKGKGPYSKDREFDSNVSAGELLGGLFSGVAVSARVAKDIYSYNQATKELKNLHPSKVDGQLFQFKDEIYLNFFGPKKRGLLGILDNTSEDRVFYFKEALKGLNKEVGEDGKPLLSNEELRAELSEVDKAYNIYQSVNKTLDEILPPFGKNNSKLSAIQKAAFRDVLFKNTMQSQRLKEKSVALESSAISSLLLQETTQQVPNMFVTKAKLVAVDERLKSSFGNYKEFLEKEKKKLISELDESDRNYASVGNILNQESVVALKNYYDSAENLYDLQKKHKDLSNVKSWNSLTSWFNNYKSNLKSSIVQEYEEENIEANKEYAKQILKTRKKAEELTVDEKKERLKNNLEILAKAGFSKSYIESLNDEDIEAQATSALADMSEGIQMMSDEAALYILSSVKDQDSLNAFLSTKRNKDKFLNLGFNDSMNVDAIKSESLRRFNEIQEINKASKKRTVRPEKLGDPTMSESVVSGKVKEKYDNRNTPDYEEQFKIVAGKANAKTILEEIINSPFASEQEKELAKEYLKAIDDDVVIEFKENWRPISKTNDTLIRKPGSTSLTSITIDLGFFGDEIQGNQSESGATSFEYTVLHELTHHFTIKALREDQELRSRLNEIAAKAEEQAKKLNKEYYGLLKNTDGTFIVEELVAEAMTSPGFQQLLMGVEGRESKTLWESFISAVLNALRKLFPGAEISGTALEEVINITSSIISGNQPNITKAKKELQALVDTKLVLDINDSKALTKLLEIYEDLLIELSSKANELELNEVVKTSILQYASDKMKTIENQIKELKKSKIEINFQGKILKKGSYVALKSYDEPWKVLDLVEDGVELESTSGSTSIRMTLTDASIIEMDGTVTDVDYFIKKRDNKIPNININEIGIIPYVNDTDKAALETPTSTRSGKADIERRRPTSYIKDSKDKKSSLETFRNEAKRDWDGVSVITGDRMKNLYVGIQLFVEAYPEHKELLDKFIKKENGTIGITNNNLSFVLNTLKKQGITTESELGGKINAKYDAEIAALETNRGGVQSDIEAKKADIERRRQEESKPVKEEIEKIQKEIDILEGDTQGSEIDSKEIEDAKKERNNLRNEDGSIPDSKIPLFNKLSKKIRFLQNSFKNQVRALVDSFSQLNNLSDKDIRVLNRFVELTDYTFEEVIQQLEKRNNTIYKRPSELDYFEDNATRSDKLNETQERADENTNERSKLAAKELGIDLDKVYYANELDAFVQKHGSKQTKFIWNLIKNIAEKLKIPTKFLLEGKGNNINKSHQGEYSNGQVANRASLLTSPDVAARTIVHELVHGVTSYIISAVKNNQTELLKVLTQKQINAAKKLSNLLRELQTDSNTKDFYGSKNEHEILAELTHDGFVEALQNKKLNFVKEFLDYILDILGIPTNAYDEALGILKDMIETPVDYVTRGFVQEGVYYSKKENSKLQELKNRLNELRQQLDKINAKYDVELAALEQSNNNQSDNKIQEYTSPQLYKSTGRQVLTSDGLSENIDPEDNRFYSFLISLSVMDFNNPKYYALLIKDEDTYKGVEIPKSKSTQEYLAAGGKRGEIAIIVDINGNPVKFDQYGVADQNGKVVHFNIEKPESILKKDSGKIANILGIDIKKANELKIQVAAKIKEARKLASEGTPVILKLTGVSEGSKVEDIVNQVLLEDLSDNDINRVLGLVDYLSKNKHQEAKDFLFEFIIAKNKDWKVSGGKIMKDGKQITPTYEDIKNNFTYKKSYQLVKDNKPFSVFKETGEIEITYPTYQDFLKTISNLRSNLTQEKYNRFLTYEIKGAFIPPKKHQGAASKLIKAKLSTLPTQLAKTIAEGAMADESTSLQYLREIVEQVNGTISGKFGNARDGAENTYGKELVEAALNFLGKSEPGIKSDEEVNQDDLFNDDDLFDSTVPQKQDNEYSNELGLFSNTDTYYLIRSIDKRIYNFLMNSAEKGSTKNIINIGNDRDFVIKVLDGVKRTLIASLEESKNEKSEDKINKINKNWSSIVDYYIQNSYIFNFSEDLSLQYDEDGNLITQEENVAKEKGFDNPGNTVSPIDGASKEIKALVRGLSRFEKIDGKFVKVRNSFATADLNNFSVTWNNLIRNLRGSSSFDDMLKKIHDNKEAYPEYEELYNILSRYKINALSGNFEAKLMIAKFYKDFINPEIPIMEVLVDLNIDTTTFKLDEATRKNIKDLKKVFLENFKTKSTQTLKTSNGDIALNPAILSMPLNTKEERIAFLNALGFEFSEETLATSEFDNLASKNNLDKYFKQEIKAVLDNGYGQFNRVVKDPITVLSRGVTKEGGIGKRINDLIALESKFSSIVPSLSMQNAEGNTEWAISRPNAYTTIIKAINDKDKYPDFQTLVLDPAYSFLGKPGAKTSIILNTLFILDTDKNYGKRRVINGKIAEIRLENISGSKILEDEGLKTTSLFIGDKLVSDFNQLLKFGSKELMRAGDKNTAYGIKIPFYLQSDGSIGKLPISNIDMFKGAEGYGGPGLESIMHKYLIGELHRIFLGRTDKINNINKISDGQERIIRKFSLFKSLLPEEVQNELYVKIDNLKDLDSFGKEIDTTLESIASEYITDLRVKKQIYEFFRQEAVKKQKSLENYGFSFSNAFWIDDTLRKYGSATLLKAYVVNEFIIHVEQTKLFNGDIVFYSSKDGEAHKRLPAFGATGLIPITDSWWVDLMNSDPKTNLQSKLLGINNTYSNTVKTVVFREYHPKSVYIDGWKQYLKSTGLSDAEISKIINPYFAIKEADAQGWITMDFYRSFKLSIGDWRVEQEKVYDKISKGIELNVGEAENLGRIFSPIKAQYAGPIHHDYIHVPAFHKFSLMPLIPSVIKGTKLEALNERMIRNNVGYALMESGSKLGTIKNGEMEAFYSKGGAMPDPTSPFINENLIYLNYLKEQVQIEPEIHDKVIFGTQFRKLLFQNIYSSGVAVNDKLAKLEKEYSKIIEDITEFEKEALLYEMGVEAVIKDSKVVDYIIKDESKLAKKVLKEVNRRKLNNNIKFFFDYDKDKLKNPLDASLNHQQIRTLVLSMINNRLIRQTIKGDMMIQGAATGYEKFTKPTDLDLEQYGTSGLRFYTVKDGKTRSSQVKLALTGDFKQLLNFEWNGELIATRERLNQALKDENWVNVNRKAITLVGYRIPTQGLNSMEFMEVAEFLPAEAGSILIVPTEIVAKAGSDFDIDKLNVFKPTLKYDKTTNRAYYVDYNKNKVSGTKAKKLAEKQELSVQLKELRDLVSILRLKSSETPSAENLDELLKWENTLRDLEFENKLILADLEELDLYKGGLYNKIIELAVARLSDESSFVQLITPNSVDLLKPQVIEMQKIAKISKKPYLHTNNLLSSTQEEKYLAGIPNKRALGIAAVANVMSQLLNKVGVKINEKLIHPMIDSNDFSNMKLKDGNLKSEIESQMINGYVDVLNEDFISQANLSEQSAGAFFYLLHLGHDKDQLLYFFSHPVIKQYNLNLLNNTSIFSKNFDYKIERDYDLALFEEARNRDDEFTLKTKNQLDSIVKNKKKRQAFINIYSAQPNTALKTLINDGLDYAEKNPEIFSKESLKNDLSKSLSQIDNNTKLAFLAYYNSVLNQSSDLLKLQQVNSFDTKATVNPMYYEFVELIKSKLLNSGTFNINPKDLTNKTVIKPFNQGVLVGSLLDTIFPVSLNKEIREAAALIYSSFADSGNFNVDFDKFARTFVNDWMYFLLINTGTLDGKKFNEYRSLLFSPELGNTLIDLKTNKKWDQLRTNYPIIQRFRLDKFEDLFNIALDRDDNSSDYQNTVIEQFTNLINFSDNTYTTEDQQYIKSFFKNLGILGIVQSGLNKSPISFTDLIPIDLYVNTMKEVVNNFKSLTKEKKDKLLSDFISKFNEINTQFFGGQNKYPYWRFKDYSKNFQAGDQLNIFDSSLKSVKNIVPLSEGLYQSILKNLFDEGLINPKCK